MRRALSLVGDAVPVAEPRRPARRELRAPAVRTSGGIPHNATLLARGEISRDEYVRRTGLDYLSLAKKLERAFKLPRSIETTDIVQELYFQTFAHVKKWNPAGAPIGRFLTFNAMSDTKKWLNEQRGAGRGYDPSVIEESLDEMTENGEHVPVDATAPTIAFAREIVRGQEDDVAECLLALLFEDSEQDAVKTLVEHRTAATPAAARRLIATAKAQAMRVYAQ